MNFEEPIVIIGAGISGLCALSHLTKHGFTNVIVYEKDSNFGGIWRSTNYPDLRIHSKSFNYRFYDFKKVQSREECATKSEILDYISDYIDSNDLAKYFNFNHQVEEIEYLQDSNTTHKCNVLVTNNQTGEITKVKASYVICAVGLLNAGKPSMPELEGVENFRGKIIHASDFDDEMLKDILEKDKKVCVLGAGKSACDINMVFIRKGLAENVTWVYRKFKWGANFHVYYNDINFMSHAKVFSEYLKLAAKEGPRSEKALDAAKKSIDTQLFINIDDDEETIGDLYQTRAALYKRDELETLKKNANRIKSSIQRLHGKTIELENGDKIQADYLLCATGYTKGGNIPPIYFVKNGNKTPCDPREQDYLFRAMINPIAPEVVIFTGELIYYQYAFANSVAAEWLVRFITNKLSRSFAQEEILQEIEKTREHFSDTCHWCPGETAENISGGAVLPFDHSYYLVQIVTDLGAKDPEGTVEKLFTVVDDQSFSNICEEFRKL